MRRYEQKSKLDSPTYFVEKTAKALKGRKTACVLTLLVLHCSNALAQADYPKADAALGEYLHENEFKHAQSIADSIESVLRDRYEGGTILRDAHTKAHGCLNADFKILDDVPSHLQHGVFVPGAQYSAKVRFSNGNSDVKRADRKGDTRGMAIKLSAVTGDALSSSPEHFGSQDFLLINFPVFFVNEAADYDEFFKIMNSGSTWRMWKLPFILGIKGSINAIKMLLAKSYNPLNTRYWSAVPYQLGEGASRMAVKYSARACSTPGDENEQSYEGGPADQSDPDFLRARLRDSVASQPACMEFMLQTAPSNSSVEELVEEWSEEESAFIPVAKLHFPVQTFDSEAQLQHCEKMSFNPWHGIQAHKPLGAVNRIRKLVYDRISEFRTTN